MIDLEMEKITMNNRLFISERKNPTLLGNLKLPFRNRSRGFYLLITGFSLIAMALTCSLPKKSMSAEERKAWDNQVRNAWKKLPKTKSLCPEFDYFPGGGIRNYYCHLKNFSNLPELEEYFGGKVFLKGPHKDGFLILDDRLDFGHYNPEFPVFLRNTMIPASKDKTFRALTQPIYNEYVRPLARTYYATYMKLGSNRVYKVRERIRYKSLIAKKTLEPYYYEKYYSFMEPGFTDDENKHVSSKFQVYPGDEEFEGNVVKTAVLFWIRRSIDKTDTEFFEGLKLLLLTYDADFLKSR